MKPTSNPLARALNGLDAADSYATDEFEVSKWSATGRATPGRTLRVFSMLALTSCGARTGLEDLAALERTTVTDQASVGGNGSPIRPDTGQETSVGATAGGQNGPVGNTNSPSTTARSNGDGVSSSRDTSPASVDMASATGSVSSASDTVSSEFGGDTSSTSSGVDSPTSGTSTSSGDTGSTSGGGTSACPPDSFDPPDSEVVDCQPLSHCLPGFYVEAEPTPSSDRKCSPCAGGYSETTDSPTCQTWTECSFDAIVEAAGTAVSDTVCASNSDILAVDAPGYWPKIASVPGHLLLLTNNYYGERLLHSYTSSDLVWLGTSPSATFGSPYSAERYLLKGEGDLVYYLDTNQIETPGYGLRPYPGAVAIDGTTRESLWATGSPEVGITWGATVLPDHTLVGLGWRIVNGVKSKLLSRWDASGALSIQSIDTIIDDYQQAYLRGSDGQGNLHITRYNPLELVRLDSAGQHLATLELGTLFDSVYDGVVTASGATYLGGDSGDEYRIVRMEPDGTATPIGHWNRVLGVTVMFVRGENLVVAGFVMEPWVRPVYGYDDAVVAEFMPDGQLLKSWQFGGPGSDAVLAGVVDDEGQITVVAEDPWAHHLVRLLP